MKTKQKIINVKNAMEIKDTNTHTARAVITDKCDEKLKNVLMSIIYDGEYISETGYKIAYSACSFFDELEEKDFTNLADILEEQLSSYEPASIWNDARLSYLDIYNEQDIFETLKEYACDSINLACAIWYDNEVKNAINTIIDEYITN